MTTEPDFIAALRTLATHPAARGLNDDAAVLGDLVFTHDMIAEGVHFLPDDPPQDVAWKLLAVNLSDLAAKGADPVGVLMGYALTGDPDWDAAFVQGLGDALAHFAVPLLGGDTIALPGKRVMGLTAIGRSARAPSRAGARDGDALWVTGTIGGAGRGLAGDPAFLSAYRRPMPLLAEGRVLAPVVHAMMDVSDGLLIDAMRMAEASDLGLAIDLDALPLPAGYPGGDRAARLGAATAGDDYQLLFALPAGETPPVAASRIGAFAPGEGLQLHDAMGPVALPERLGYLHG